MQGGDGTIGEGDPLPFHRDLVVAGLEVDGVEPVAGSFHGVVVGEVVECAQHPNADKLRVTKVNVGGDRLLDIVCGAPNCRQGLKVAVATVGAVLPGDFKIKAAKLRGEPSEGMLCSFSELGISDDHNGIIELPLDAPIGTDIREYLKLDDNTIEISVTPNRADCLGIIGVARDVAVLNKAPLVEPEIAPVVATISDVLPIQVEAVEACPRYLGRVVKGINVKAPTPLWMKEKLRRCGIRSIDAVVEGIPDPSTAEPLVTEERKHGSPVTAALKQLGGSMPVEKACKEIYDGIFSSEFMIIPGTQARILAKISRVLPAVYRSQIDKKLDKIIRQQL